MTRAATILFTACALLAAPAPARAQMDPPPDALDVAWAKGCKTLVKLIRAAGLTAEVGEGAKSLAGERTLLAPSDAAFAKLSAERLAQLQRPERRGELRALLARHVLVGRVRSSALPNGRARHLLGGRLLGWGGTKLVAADLPASNGLVHVVDTVLLPSALHAQRVDDIAGKQVPLARYEGKVLLIVNTASRCGYTPQYRGLEQLHRRYKDRGLVVLGFPCNDFGGQEPGTLPEIQRFCKDRYQVSFPLFSKVTIRGDAPTPLYRLLTGATRTQVRWNFTKFLVGRDGKVLSAHASGVRPLSKPLTAAIEQALGPKPKPKPKPKRWF